MVKRALQVPLLAFILFLPTTDAGIFGFLIDLAIFFFARSPDDKPQSSASPSPSNTMMPAATTSNIFLRPTSSPANTNLPSTIPSAEPSKSSIPTLSMVPTSSTIPSSSMAPSTVPSSSPSMIPSSSMKPSTMPSSSLSPSVSPTTSSPSSTPSTIPTTPPPLPNIVIFYADDMDHDSVVNGEVQTPNLDELASNGIIFPHNCVIFSQCWVSRATELTGMYASVHKQLRTKGTAIFDEVVAWNETLFPQLKLAGYHVVRVYLIIIEPSLL